LGNDQTGLIGSASLSSPSIFSSERRTVTELGAARGEREPPELLPPRDATAGPGGAYTYARATTTNRGSRGLAAGQNWPILCCWRCRRTNLDMSIRDPRRRPQWDREMPDTNVRTLVSATEFDSLALGRRARALTRAEFTARGKAFRFPKGQSGNSDGQSKFWSRGCCKAPSRRR
jgi:hypothetical protein